MNYAEVFGWLLLVSLMVISASPTQAQDTVEPIKHRVGKKAGNSHISQDGGK